MPSMAITINMRETEKKLPIQAIFEVPNNPIPIATVIREKVGDLKFVSELM